MANMGDLYVNITELTSQIDELQSLLNTLRQQMVNVGSDIKTIRDNWKGDEFNKADPKLKEILQTLDNACNDLQKQINFLTNKRDNFRGTISGL